MNAAGRAHLWVLAIALLGVKVEAFSWDSFNTQRLFNRSDEIFSNLRVEPSERTCLEAFKSFVDGVKRGDNWALKVIDSWGKEPAGLYSLANADFGHFDQCLEAREKFSTTHCQIDSLNAEKRPYLLGTCMPDSCSYSAVKKVLEPFFENIELETKEVFYCSNGTHFPFETLQWGALVSFSLIALLIVGSSVYEFFGGKGYFLGFSLIRNSVKLMEMKPNFGPMNCLNGIRVISSFWIVLHHSYQGLTRISTFYNPKRAQAFELTFFRAFVHHADLAVDTFFMMGGLLLAFSFLKSVQKGAKFNYFKFVLHRYLRLVPVWAAVMVIFLAYGPMIVTGPKQYILESNYRIENCMNYWWSGLLLIQNHLNSHNICIGPSWYISADFQLYVVSPLILFPLAKYGKRFYPVMALIGLASMSFIFAFVLTNGWHFNYSTPAYKDQTYYPAYARLAQWLMGIALGHYLFKTQGQELKIKKSLNLVLMVVSLAVLACCIIVPYTQYHNQTEAPVTFTFFSAFHRQLWALAMSWIVLACIKGHGGAVNWFLSFPFYQPLAKLTYTVYLIHVPTLFVHFMLPKGLIYFHEYVLVLSFFGGLLACLILATPIVLMIEMPIPTVEKGIFSLLGGKKSEAKIENQKKIEDNKTADV